MIVYSFDGGGPRYPGGPCGWGWVAHQVTSTAEVRELVCGHGGLEATTNNVAEYTALKMAMTHALASSYSVGVEFLFQGDSALVISQVSGEWAVKAPHLRPLRDEVCHLWDGLGRPELRWIPRDQNDRADMLATQGRDNYSIVPWRHSGPIPMNHTVRKFKRR